MNFVALKLYRGDSKHSRTLLFHHRLPKLFIIYYAVDNRVFFRNASELIDIQTIEGGAGKEHTPLIHWPDLLNFTY